MKTISRLLAAAALTVATPGVVADARNKPANASLEQAYATLHASHFVDLTHAFGPGIPHWKGFPDEQIKSLYTYETAGFRADEYSHAGQWGTHVDPPAHFIPGGRTVDQIRPDEMILRLVVIDIHEEARRNPDYVATLDDVRRWERTYGPIPRDAFVVLRTDWSKRWPNDAAMHNIDREGVAHYPGWSLAVLHYLLENRKVTAIGHETTDTDPGIATTKDDYSLERYVLSTDHYQIEMLCNLDKIPTAGALALVTFPKPQNGSGFPARVIAVLP